MSVFADVPLRCFCGAVQGHLASVAGSPNAGVRLVCYCDDCQAFAQGVGAPEPLFDAHGGSEGFHTTHSRVRITTGHSHLACLRLTPKGMLRWYTSCCRTPIAATFAQHRMPFASVMSCILGDADQRERALGPVRYRLMTRYATGAVPAGAPGYPLSFKTRMLGRLAVSALRGAHQPSPFFDEATGQPVAEPTLLRAANGAVPSPGS